jgi:hypothetical protein
MHWKIIGWSRHHLGKLTDAWFPALTGASKPPWHLNIKFICITHGFIRPHWGPLGKLASVRSSILMLCFHLCLFFYIGKPRVKFWVMYLKRQTSNVFREGMGTSFPLCLRKLEFQELSCILKAASCHGGQVLQRCIIRSYVFRASLWH